MGILTCCLGLKDKCQITNAWSAPFYNYDPGAFSAPLCHILLRALFSTIGMHFLWVLDWLRQQACVASLVCLRAILLILGQIPPL